MKGNSVSYDYVCHFHTNYINMKNIFLPLKGVDFHSICVTFSNCTDTIHRMWMRQSWNSRKKIQMENFLGYDGIRTRRDWKEWLEDHIIENCIFSYRTQNTPYISTYHHRHCHVKAFSFLLLKINWNTWNATKSPKWLLRGCVRKSMRVSTRHDSETKSA